MKKIVLIIAAIVVSVSAFASDHFSRDVIFISETGGVMSVKSTATSTDKKLAPIMAVKSAIDTYIFAGIADVNDGKPKAEESVRTSCNDYFRRLFDENRYAVFVKGYQEVDKTKKNSMGLYESTVIVGIYRKALDRDLLSNGVVQPEASEIKVEKLEEELVMPSIMVVPYKLSTQRYKDILENDFDKRTAVAKVQEDFQEKGLETVDFEAKYNAALRSLEFESEMADAFDVQLIKNSGADVYVTVDIKKTSSYGSSKVSMTLKAHDTATARIIASEISEFSGQHSTFDRLCTLAIQQVSKSFIGKIKTGLAKKVDAGSTVSLRVSIDGSSYKSLDDAIDDDDFGISDYVRSWLRKNAVGGKFHQQGKTDLAIIFDEIKIPNKNADGDLQDATDFAVRLTRFLKKKGVNAKNRLDGSTIYITIAD